VYTFQQELYIWFGGQGFYEHMLVAYQVPKTFYRPQGVVGLSYPLLAVSPYPNFIQTLINKGFISTYSFGLNLNFQSNSSSYITFGAANPSLYTGTLNIVKLIGNYAYKIQLDSMQFGNGPNLALFSAILDSGNTCITIPSRYANIIVGAFSIGSNVCAFDVEPLSPEFKLLRCRIRNFTILPDVNIYINKIKYSVGYNGYFQRCVQSGADAFCDSFVEIVNFGNNVFIGDGFFNEYYTYFDLHNNEVGIAKNNNNLSYKNTFQPYSVLTQNDIKFYNSL
jgi:hypothetical protein